MSECVLQGLMDSLPVNPVGFDLAYKLGLLLSLCLQLEFTTLYKISGMVTALPVLIGGVI